MNLLPDSHTLELADYASKNEWVVETDMEGHRNAILRTDCATGTAKFCKEQLKCLILHIENQGGGYKQ